MKSKIRKIGNSKGTVIPAKIFKKLHLEDGDNTEIEEDRKSIVITSCTERPKYKLKDLLKECSTNSPVPDALQEWIDLPSSGCENIC